MPAKQLQNLILLFNVGKSRWNIIFKRFNIFLKFMDDNKICIIDPANWCPGLKFIYKNSSYYCHEPDSFFDYSSITNHYTNDKFEEVYGFRFKTNYEEIEGNLNFEIIIIVFPLLDGIKSHSMTKNNAVNILEKIYKIIKKSNFKKKILFDIYDYDYDPSLFENPSIDLFFKRNYNKYKKYNKNVIPFPFCMFTHPCLLWNMFNKKNMEPVLCKKSIVFWTGSLYTHENKDFHVYRDRQEIFNKIKQYLEMSNGLDNTSFIEKIRNSKLCLDLNGVGDPNYRTFEIFYNGSLIMQHETSLLWPFDEEFPPKECIFNDEFEFLEKTSKLLNDEKFYKKVLCKQQDIINKYMNITWIRNYINKCAESIQGDILLDKLQTFLI